MTAPAQDGPLARELMTSRERELFPEFDWLPLPLPPPPLVVQTERERERMLAALGVPKSFLEGDPVYSSMDLSRR